MSHDKRRYAGSPNSNSGNSTHDNLCVLSENNVPPHPFV